MESRPNPYAVVAREEIQIHLFGMADLDLLAAVGPIDDLPRSEAIDLLRQRGAAMDQWWTSIIAHLMRHRRSRPLWICTRGTIDFLSHQDGDD